MSPKSYQYKFDSFLILPAEKLLISGERVISLSNRAFDLLFLFTQNEGKVILKQELLNKVWADTFVEEGNLAVAINSLRKALKTDDNKVYIETFPKRGYRFNAKVEKVLVESNLEKDVKQPVSLLISNPPVETELPAASLPKSALRNAYKFIQSQLIQRKWLLLALILMILSYCAFIVAFPEKNQVQAMQQTTSDSSKIRIAILPFVDLRPSLDTKDLGLSFADSTMFELAKTDEFSINSSIPIDKYFQKIPQPEELKKEVDVDYILASTFLKNGESVEVDSQLIEVKTGKVVMTNKENLISDQISVMREQFTKKLVSKIRLYSNAVSAFLKNKK